MAETEIEYDFQPDDYMKFQTYHLENSPSHIRQNRFVIFGVAIIFVLMPLIMGSIMYVSNPRPDFSNWVIEQTVLTSIVAILWIILIPPVIKAYNNFFTRKVINEGKNKGLFGLKKVILSEEYFKAIDDTSETIVKWGAFEKVVEHEGYIFIYNTAVTACIIPQRAFKSDEEKKQFVKVVNGFIENAGTL